ncbi:MAG: WbqC family protein [Firmicutes bacterium]|nr:WbqC family protein [Bacillota bacterium]
MSKVIAIHQPNYIPWIGYFHKMLNSDIFVIADDVQLSTQSVTHRNKIKSANGVILLTVPLARKKVLIKDVEIYNEEDWGKKHFQTLQHCYARSDYWSQYKKQFEEIYNQKWVKLIDLNMAFMTLIRNIFNIETPMVYSSQLPDLQGRKSERIIDICEKLGGSVYLSGQGAKAYNDKEIFNQHNIELKYQQFEHPVYSQLWGDFVDKLSVVDLIFNCGPQGKKILEASSGETS